MRVVNVLIALVLLGGVCALAPASMRQGLFLAITLAWIPMGAYFIASNNPSSWAITGVFSYGAGLFGALRSDGRRRWESCRATQEGQTQELTASRGEAHHPEIGTQPVSLSIQANGAGKPPVLDSDGAARFQAVWSRSLDAEWSYPAYPEAHCIRVGHELLEGARG